MSKRRRFPTNFFKSLLDDPLLDDSVSVMEAPAPAEEEDPFASIAASFMAPLDAHEGHKPGQALPATDPVFRDQMAHSIFAPPALRDEIDNTQHQLFFVREQDESLDGLREVNALLRKGWSVVNTFATGCDAGYKALVLLERRA